MRPTLRLAAHCQHDISILSFECSNEQPARARLIFCTVALDVLALGLMIPVLPQIVLGFIGGDIAAAAEMFGASPPSGR